jgi:hypothetical protein
VTTDHPNNGPTGAAAVGHDETRYYEIRVAGRLADRWNSWFDGLAVRPEPDGTTVISGPVVDQAALHGVLHRLRDIGIPLISLTEVPYAPNHSNGPSGPATEGN